MVMESSGTHPCDLQRWPAWDDPGRDRVAGSNTLPSPPCSVQAPLWPADAIGQVVSPGTQSRRRRVRDRRNKWKFPVWLVPGSWAERVWAVRPGWAWGPASGELEQMTRAHPRKPSPGRICGPFGAPLIPSSPRLRCTTQDGQWNEPHTWQTDRAPLSQSLSQPLVVLSVTWKRNRQIFPAIPSCHVRAARWLAMARRPCRKALSPSFRWREVVSVCVCVCVYGGGRG